MGKETEEISSDRFSRLPAGIRKHIRRMKESGDREGAFRVRKTLMQEQASKRLNGSLEKLGDIDDPVEIAAQSIKVAWLMHAAGQIDFEERFEQTEQIYEPLTEEVAGKVVERWKVLREDIERLMPKVEPSR